MIRDLKLKKYSEIISKLILYLCFLLSFLLAIYLRNRDFASLEGEYLLGNDAYRFFYQAERIIKDHHLPKRDMMRWLPLGRDLTTHLNFSSYIIASLWFFLHFIIPSLTLYQVAVFYPILCYILTLIILFLLIRKLFDTNVSLLPGTTCILLLLTILPIFAQEPSLAGGGMLLLNGEQAYAMVPPHDVLLKDYHEGITIDGWLYLKEYPKEPEVWMLLHKPGAFQMTLLPSTPGHVFFMFAAAWKTQRGSHGSSIGIQFQVPLRQWLYFYGAIGKEKLKKFTILDGEMTEPLVIGRKLTDNDLLDLHKRFEYTPFSGAIDELRISNLDRGLVGKTQIYLGTGEEAPQNVPIPKKRFQPDEHTVALWHFDNGRTVFLDASKNALTMFAREGAFNPMALSVLPKGKVVATWGRIKGSIVTSWESSTLP